MDNLPYTAAIKFPEIIPERCDEHIIRRLTSMRGQFSDQPAYDQLLSKADVLLYEVYAFVQPEVDGELDSGISIIHPGKVGQEYFMTKGHFHRVLDTAEVYYCLKGKGVMVMETPEGAWNVKDLTPGTLLYVPPRWAHRSVNTSDSEDLVIFYVYPAHAGHDYGTIETQGFRKLIVDQGKGAEITDNPRWLAPEDRK